MARTTKYSTRSVLLVMVCVLSALPVFPAKAQNADPSVQLLQNQVKVLQDQVRRLEVIAKDELALRQEVEQLKLSAIQQKARVDVIELKQVSLVADVETLKSQQPTDPGKSPPPKPSDKLTDNQVLTLRAPFIVKDSAGQVIFKIEGAPDRDLPRATVGNPAGAHVEMGPSAGGSAVVKIFGSSGKAVAGMYSDVDGGGLSLTGAGGGNSVVSLAATANGGRVRVFPAAGGTARAELAATDTYGAINVFSANGSNAGSLASTEARSGRIELNNDSGSIVVQAGATQQGTGFVITGPYNGGIAGVMAGAGTGAASSLLGRLTAKK